MGFRAPIRPALVAVALSGSLAAMAQEAAPVPECLHDAGVVERFIPVEMITGHALPEAHVLQLQPVDRVYPYVEGSVDHRGCKGETRLSGPVAWTGIGGVAYEVYERQVPRARERIALTKDRTAMGRVYDDRIGDLVNEGKFPVGIWTQGQKRAYATTYHTPRGSRALQSFIEIEKLSCVYEGVPGALQIRWRNSGGSEYGYIFAPGRGLVQVVAYKRG